MQTTHVVVIDGLSCKNTEGDVVVIMVVGCFLPSVFMCFQCMCMMILWWLCLQYCRRLGHSLAILESNVFVARRNPLLRPVINVGQNFFNLGETHACQKYRIAFN